MLARVRLPGGLVDAVQLQVLAGLADEFGDGRVELTSRGNVQLRGLAEYAAGPLTSELVQAGLLPSLSHDRVRNVLASPLAGLDRGPDLTGIVRALDAALCARPRLAELSGAGVKSRPARAARSRRNARRNASFSKMPCHVVPRTEPVSQPSRKGWPPSGATVPWWIS